MSPMGLERAVTSAPGVAPESKGRRGYLGVPGIDELLPTGVSYGSQIMNAGETGVGKTVLAAQFLYEGLLVGDACVYIACDESPQAMRLAMANLRLGTVAYERAGRLVFVDAFGREQSPERIVVREPRDLDELFATEVEIVKGLPKGRTRVIVDSLSTVFGTQDRATVINFNRDRQRFLTSRGALVLDNYVTGLLDEQTMAGLGHTYPLIIRMGYREGDGDQRERFLSLGKLRSGMFSGSRRGFRIDPRAGIVVQR